MNFLSVARREQYAPSRRVRLFLMVFVSTVVIASMALVFGPELKDFLHYSAGSGTSVKLSSPAAGEDVFKDVAFADQNGPAIAVLKQKGLVRGFDDGTYKPYDPVKREEFIKLAVASRKADPHPLNNSNCFKDVGVEWFARYVCYARRMGWVQGYEDGKFGAGENITVAEALIIINRSFGVDVSGPGLDPKADLLRGDAAGLIVRALEYARSASAR